MQNAIKSEIKNLASRVFARKAAIEKQEHEYRERYEKRTGLAAGASTKPATTYPDRHFDPVYCKRNANFLAKTIWFKVLNGTYKPKPAVNFHIAKPAGGKRSLMAFSLPDAALANVLMRVIRERNIKKFSPHSFAYHPEKNVFDAVLDLTTYIKSTTKIYSVQVDFSDYFDSIPSKYIIELLNDRELLSLTVVEKAAIREFLFHRYAQKRQYAAGDFSVRRRGTPQGSSISLILANLANHHLDVRLEKMPGKFVRFADDVTALCGDYQSAVEIESCFDQHCEATGISINRKKSPGIALLANNEGEIRTAANIDYLGYRFKEDSLTLSDAAVARIKRKLSRLINIYLVENPRNGEFSLMRVGHSPDFDWDLMGLISEIRNYLYGGLSEKDLDRMLYEGKKLRRMKGLMSFYSLLDDDDILSMLDGWLVNSVRRAIRKRNKLLLAKFSVTGLSPSNKALILGTWMSPAAWRGDPKPEFRIPSFKRGWRAARKFYYTFGLKDIEPPKYGYAYSF